MYRLPAQIQATVQAVSASSIRPLAGRIPIGQGLIVVLPVGFESPFYPGLLERFRIGLPEFTENFDDLLPAESALSDRYQNMIENTYSIHDIAPYG